MKQTVLDYCYCVFVCFCVCYLLVGLNMLIDNVCMLIEQNMYHVIHAVLNKSSSTGLQTAI